jgi:hypothetical protein
MTKMIKIRDDNHDKDDDMIAQNVLRQDEPSTS